MSVQRTTAKKKHVTTVKASKAVPKSNDSPQTKKAESVREAYDRLKPKWTSGRPKNFKRWALQYRQSLRKRA